MFLLLTHNKQIHGGPGKRKHKIYILAGVFLGGVGFGKGARLPATSETSRTLYVIMLCLAAGQGQHCVTTDNNVYLFRTSLGRNHHKICLMLYFP